MGHGDVVVERPENLSIATKHPWFLKNRDHNLPINIFQLHSHRGRIKTRGVHKVRVYIPAADCQRV